MKLYERCANDIAELIRSGVLRPGDKLPSVRDASLARSMSRSTIFEAYYLLETDGLIEARPRSGYYVRSGRMATALPEPCDSTPDGLEREVAVGQLVLDLLGCAGRREFVPLGSAFLSPTLCPLKRLARHLWTEMRDFDSWHLIEDLAAGNESLRRQLVLRYAIDGMAVDPAELVLTSGAMEGLNLCLHAVTQPGDVVVVESPTFYAALQALERLHLRAVEVATAPGRGIDIDALATTLRQHRVAACWLMPNFQNPLGSLMPQENKEALVAMLAEREIALIEDDAYAELYFGARKPLPAKAFDTNGLVMHCGSFSKCLAPGYRVGWVAGVAWERPDIAARVSLTYNSEVDHDFDTVERGPLVDPDGPGPVPALPLLEGTSTTTVSTPESWNLEFQTGVAADTLVFGSIRWVEWSAFRVDPRQFTTVTGGGLVDLEDTTT
ncbi:MAG: aminotransferase class I/II-fold pyridoxal phosphate-dependent enzyme, partial [Gammaproteobacteria bacterium]|nr:aminotransferase class I/II-fold pyridoxal phosphate-dependent enzyme [Gammaproteobacteria bacterium]